LLLMKRLCLTHGRMLMKRGMKQIAIDPAKRRTLKAQAACIGDGWYLAGGTALGLHLGHRSSRDLDWFSPKRPDYAVLKGALERARPAFTDQGLVVPGGSTLRFYYDGLETSFIAFNRFDAEVMTMFIDGAAVKVASIAQIAAMKAVAVCSRSERRDYIDIYAILQHRSWNMQRFFENSERLARWPRQLITDALSEVDDPKLLRTWMPSPCAYAWEEVVHGLKV
jgi:hypothetical protein